MLQEQKTQRNNVCHQGLLQFYDRLSVDLPHVPNNPDLKERFATITDYQIKDELLILALTLTHEGEKPVYQYFGIGSEKKTLTAERTEKEKSVQVYKNRRRLCQR